MAHAGIVERVENPTAAVFGTIIVEVSRQEAAAIGLVEMLADEAFSTRLERLVDGAIGTLLAECFGCQPEYVWTWLKTMVPDEGPFPTSP